MLKRYVLTCCRTAGRLSQAPVRLIHAQSLVSRPSTARTEASRKLHVGNKADLSTAYARSYATAAEAARTNQEYRTVVDLELVNDDGTSTTVGIHPSYPNKPKAVANLLASLPELLTDAGMPSNVIDTFTTRGWDLDEYGDTIHRYVEVTSEQDTTSILDQIAAAAKELKHDPHIHAEAKQLTISCTTHMPPGLSMKDVKLARMIDGILQRASKIAVTHGDEADILTQRQRGREHNMEAIRKAKQDCGCG